MMWEHMRTAGRQALGLIVRLSHVLPLVAFLVIWELIAPSPTSGLPPPSTWWEAVKAMETSGVLGEAIAHTAWTFVAGLGLACVLGLVMGGLIALSRPLEEATTWLIDFGRALPVVVVIPPAVLVLKYGTTLELFTVCFGAIWPIVLAVVRGSRDIPPTLFEVGSVFRLSAWTNFRKLVIPALLPAFLSGVRIATPMALIGAIAVELLTGSGGIGTELSLAAGRLDTPAVWALVVVAGIGGWIVNVLSNAAFRGALRSRGRIS
ncbi:MAG: ABC transporter permease subunit [Gemmatimonas sp.]|nr:ABC transporter permease subunit [Gemmatimonas sp.]